MKNDLSSSLLPYRQGVGMVVFNSNGLIFMGKRKDLSQPSWQMPQGGIDEGETPQKALFRELQEEVGTQNVRLIQESSQWLQYDFPSSLENNPWKGHFRGQQQKWFLLQFLGEEKDICLETPHGEFKEWGWFSPQEVLEASVGFKKTVYEKILQEFSPFIVQCHTTRPFTG